MSRRRSHHHASRSLGLLLAAALASGLLGCSGPAPEPVATLGLDTDQLELPFPEWRSLRLTWTPTRALDAGASVRVFLHLLDSDHELVRTFDHPFPGEWKVGEPVGDEVRLYQSALGPPLPPGAYTLTAGLHAADGERFPIEVEGRPNTLVGRFEYSIARVTVPEVSPDAPGFTFADAWDDLEAGADTQVLGRRWLEGDGIIRILNLEVPGSVWLRLDIPKEGEPGGRQVAPRSPGEAPTLEIVSTCSGVTRTVEVPGMREEVLPVYPRDGAPECEILLTANYRLVDPKARRTDVAALEVIAFTPAEL
ncbi:MAG: hypothetical protein KDD11_06190 [Acidobacteria bacterium]|nr:hypothetical protein [Acidobacteriota bacterium]